MGTGLSSSSPVPSLAAISSSGSGNGDPPRAQHLTINDQCSLLLDGDGTYDTKRISMVYALIMKHTSLRVRALVDIIMYEYEPVDAHQQHAISLFYYMQPSHHGIGYLSSQLPPRATTPTSTIHSSDASASASVPPKTRSMDGNGWRFIYGTCPLERADHAVHMQSSQRVYLLGQVAGDNATNHRIVMVSCRVRDMKRSAFSAVIPVLSSSSSSSSSAAESQLSSLLSWTIHDIPDEVQSSMTAKTRIGVYHRDYICFGVFHGPHQVWLYDTRDDASSGVGGGGGGGGGTRSHHRWHQLPYPRDDTGETQLRPQFTQTHTGQLIMYDTYQYARDRQAWIYDHHHHSPSSSSSSSLTSSSSSLAPLSVSIPPAPTTTAAPPSGVAISSGEWRRVIHMTVAPRTICMVSWRASVMPPPIINRTDEAVSTMLPIPLVPKKKSFFWNLNTDGHSDDDDVQPCNEGLLILTYSDDPHEMLRGHGSATAVYTHPSPSLSSSSSPPSAVASASSSSTNSTGSHDKGSKRGGGGGMMITDDVTSMVRYARDIRWQRTGVATHMPDWVDSSRVPITIMNGKWLVIFPSVTCHSSIRVALIPIAAILTPLPSTPAPAPSIGWSPPPSSPPSYASMVATAKEYQGLWRWYDALPRDHTDRLVLITGQDGTASAWHNYSVN